MVPQRIDAYLTQKGYFESRVRAARAVRSGFVRVNGRLVGKPSLCVSGADEIRVSGDPVPFVNKAALKMDLFLEETGISVSGFTVCDAGASTGGFTQIMLQHGASHVWAVDVGRGQFHSSLRDESRVTLKEQCDIREFLRKSPAHFELIVADLSFISLKRVVPVMSGASRRFLFLFKPQFETSPNAKNKKGVVTDLSLHQSILESFRDYLLKEGLFPLIIRRSRLLGGEGNREYFIFCKKKSGMVITPDDIKREVFKDEDFLDL